MLDFATLMQRAQRERWTLLALDSPADLSTPSGEALASMLMVFSQMERRLIGQRTKDALAVKWQQGVQLGRPRTMPDEVRARTLKGGARSRRCTVVPGDGAQSRGRGLSHRVAPVLSPCDLPGLRHLLEIGVDAGDPRGVHDLGAT